MGPGEASDDLQRALAGDHAAFAALVKACDGKMRGLAFRLLGSATAMDDALQDAYLKAFRHLDRFEGDAAFSTWVYTIVYRTCLDHLRRRRRSRGIEMDLGSVSEAAIVSGDHSDRQAEADLLDRALRELPPDQAAVVALVDGDGCTYGEAAAVLGVREGTIASRLNRAHQVLRVALESRSEGGGERE